ncbi:unnamed protein product, partial [Porites lobata]
KYFLQKSLTIEQEFLEGTKRFYNAEMALTDYQKDPEGARKEVNDWVENKTKENIKNLIPEGVFNSGTVLTLVNAIYSKGIWQNEFDRRATRSKDFFVSKNEKAKVKMMKLKTNFKHIANGGELDCQLLELPYQGEDPSMLILKEVNDWVENKTKENIKNLIPEGIIDSSTELILVNAIYFKGIWQNEFDRRATRSKDFFVSKKKKVKVKMMKLKTNFKYIANVGELGCQLLELPYQGEDLSMLILLPQDKYGLASVEASLTHDKLQKAIALTQVQPSGEVKVYLPRFNMTQEFQLKKLLAKMGVTDMFNAIKADFTGISPGLFVTHVIHKAFVEVNEKGTEAAAATAVIMSRSKSPSGGSAKIPVFCADHPFLFLLCHKKSGGILFMGRMMKPEPLD